jgi:hypothetical protein
MLDHYSVFGDKPQTRRVKWLDNRRVAKPALMDRISLKKRTRDIP